MAINREISQFSNFVSVDDNTKKVSISTSFDIGGDSVISGNVGIGSDNPTAKLDVDGTLNVSGISTFQNSIRVDNIKSTSTNTDITVQTADYFDIWDLSGSKRAFGLSIGGSVDLNYNGNPRLQTTADGIKVLNGTSETAVISGPQNIILDPSPDDVVAITTGAISAAGVSTITGITTTNIAVGNLIQEVDGVISAGTTVTSVGISSLTISNVSLGAATNQEFAFVNQTPTGIVRIKGDLYIDGTRTEINSTTLTVDDLNVVVASGAENGLSADGAGLTVDGADAYLKYNYNAGTNENWEINKNLNIGIAATSTDLPGLYLKGNSSTTNFLQNPSISIGGTTNSKKYDTFLVDDPNVQYVRHWANGFDINFSIQDARQFVVSNISGANSITPPGVSDNQIAFKIIPESSTELRYNKVKKLETTGYGVTVTGGLNVSGISTFQNNAVFEKNAYWGNAGGGTGVAIFGINEDLEIGATGNRGQILNKVGELRIISDTEITLKDRGGSFYAKFTEDGSAQLYHDGDTKFETTGYGVTVTGGLNVSGISTFGSDVNVSGIVTAQLFSGNGGSLTNVSAFEAYKSDISERAYKTDEISGSLVYAYNGQRFSNLGTGTGSSNDFAVKSVISKDGKVAFVSEYDTTNTSLNSGRVHIYERTGANFTAIGIVTQTSHSSPGAAQTTTCFGPIVACNADGSIFAVGSPQGNYHGSGSGFDASNFSWWHNPAGPGQQSVHIFQKNGSTITNIGILTSPSLGSDSNGSDSFGGALAFSDDGSRLYVGSPRRDNNNFGENFGAVFAYDKSGTTYNYVGIITTTSGLTALGGGIGQALACSSDGNILFSGWPGAYRPRSDGSGSSYSGVIEIYDRSGSNFTNIGIVSSGYYISGNVLGQDFGNEIACSDDGTYLYATSRESGTGAEQYPHGKLHLFKRESNTYSEVSSDTLDSPVELDNRLGWGLACSSDGSKVIAGECNFVSSGTTGFVHYYGRVGDGIVRVGFATAGIAQGGSYQFATFGFSVDLSGSGEVGIVGSPYQEYVNTGSNGAVFFLKETRGTTVYSDILTGNIGIGTDNPTSSLDVNGTLNVSGISTFSGNVNLGDDDKLRLGDSDDLQIYHTGGGSNYIDSEFGVQGLQIRTTTGNIEFKLKGRADNALKLIEDGAVELYFDNSKKLETTGDGIDITGITTISQQLLINDFADNSSTINTKLYVNGRSVFQDTVRVGVGGTIGDLLVSGKIGIGTTQPTAKLDVNGTLNVSGVSTFLDNVRLGIGTNGSNITRTYNTDINGDSDVLSITSVNDKHQIVQIGFSTTTGTNPFTANLQFEGKLGNTLFDYKPLIEFKKPLAIGGVGLEIGYNSGTISHSWLNTDGSQYYSMDNNGDKFIILRDGAGNYPSSSSGLIFEGGYNDGVKLYHTGNKKLETIGYGVSVTGGLNVSGISTFQDDINVGAGKSILWDGTDNFHITTTSGHGLVETSGELYFGTTHLYIQKPGGTTTMAEFIQDGAVKLNHNNSTKLQTHDYGIDVTGRVETDTLNVSGIATAQKFVGDGSELTNLPPAGSDLVSYASASNIANSAESISGISSYIQLDSLLSSQTAGASRPWRFGRGPAMSADASTLIVGAPQGSLNGSSDNTGLVHVFDREGNSYREVGILTAGAYADDIDDFGFSVACSTDGRRIVVGANADEPLGSTGGGLVHIFDRQGDTFTRVAVLTGSYASQSGDSFGYEVDCSGDGNVIVVGAKYDETGASASTGVVYVFDRSGNNFTEVGIITSSSNAASDALGQSVSISEDGNTIVASAIGDGSNDEGKVYVFDRTGTNTFNEVGILTGGTYADDSSEFGTRVKISSNGKTIVVGCPNAEVDEAVDATGLVHVFDRNPDNTFTRVGVLTGSHASQGSDYFGDLIDVSADGNTIAVGAYFDELTGGNAFDDDDGLGYIFTRQGDTFEEVSTFIRGKVPTLSADGKTVAFGDPDYESGGSGAGRVVIYEQQRQTYLYSTSTGNIGIGSQTPTTKLDVDGGLKVSGVSTFTSATSSWAIDAIGKVRIGDGQGSILPTYGLYLTENGASNNSSVIDLLTLNSSPSGSISAGHGSGIKFTGKNTGGGASTYASIEAVIESVGVTGGGALVFKTDGYNGGNTERLRINESGNIGIGTASPIAKLDVNGSVAIKNHSIVSITTSHTASAGTPFTIDTFATSANDLAEYTIHVGYGNTIQAQKVLVMHDGTTAYSQEYAVMSQPSKIVSIEASISGGNVLLQATPETGISGITTYKIVRGGLV
jgi:hypothetical protein